MKRNGNIEIMRFVFCWIIIFFHINDKLLEKVNMPLSFLTFSQNGRIGVEFFFIISGFFLAKSAQSSECKSLSSSTYQFMKKKLFGILPYHIPAFIFTFVIYFVSRTFTIREGILKSLGTVSNFLLIQEAGFKTTKIMGIEWYISSMLIAMMILFPLCVKYKENFKRIVCPVISLLLLGYLSHETKKLGGTSDFVFGGIIAKTIVRAFAEMGIGIFVYELIGKLKKKSLSKTEKLLMTIAEPICYVLPIIYCFSDFPEWVDYYALLFIALGVLLTLSEQSYFSNRFNNKFVYFLGKFSLPLYLSQKFALYFTEAYIMPARIRITVGSVCVITVFIAIIVYIIGSLIIKVIGRASPPDYFY
ncbi:MAG: acyltransferase [Eubacterium sp.]|nr:acyltransferase [Eubacterium sp.]